MRSDSQSAANCRLPSSVVAAQSRCLCKESALPFCVLDFSNASASSTTSPVTLMMHNRVAEPAALAGSFLNRSTEDVTRDLADCSFVHQRREAAGSKYTMRGDQRTRRIHFRMDGGNDLSRLRRIIVTAASGGKPSCVNDSAARASAIDARRRMPLYHVLPSRPAVDLASGNS